MAAQAPLAATQGEPRRTALVTGGTRGIGLGIARALAAEGYDLVLGYNSDEAAAGAAQAALEKDYGVAVHTVAGDVALPQTAQALFQVVRERFGGRLTALVHNAGLYVGLTTARSECAPPEGAAPDDFEAAYEYYQKVYPRCFKRCLIEALKCEGLRHVVAISSPGCNNTQTAKPGYEMPGQAKASMEFLVRCYARTLAKQGINVNTVIPGYIATGAWDKIFSSGVGSRVGMGREAVDARIAQTPGGRWLQAEEVGGVVAFLCSPRGAVVTGVALPVDLGLHLS